MPWFVKLNDGDLIAERGSSAGGKGDNDDEVSSKLTPSKNRQKRKGPLHIKIRNDGGRVTIDSSQSSKPPTILFDTKRKSALALLDEGGSGGPSNAGCGVLAEYRSMDLTKAVVKKHHHQGKSKRVTIEDQKQSKSATGGQKPPPSHGQIRNNNNIKAIVISGNKIRRSKPQIGGPIAKNRIAQKTHQQNIIINKHEKHDIQQPSSTTTQQSSKPQASDNHFISTGRLDGSSKPINDKAFSAFLHHRSGGKSAFSKVIPTKAAGAGTGAKKQTTSTTNTGASYPAIHSDTIKTNKVISVKDFVNHSAETTFKSLKYPLNQQLEPMVAETSSSMDMLQLQLLEGLESQAGLEGLDSKTAALEDAEVADITSKGDLMGIEPTALSCCSPQRSKSVGTGLLLASSAKQLLIPKPKPKPAEKAPKRVPKAIMKESATNVGQKRPSKAVAKELAVSDGQKRSPKAVAKEFAKSDGQKRPPKAAVKELLIQAPMPSSFSSSSESQQKAKKELKTFKLTVESMVPAPPILDDLSHVIRVDDDSESNSTNSNNRSSLGSRQTPSMENIRPLISVEKVTSLHQQQPASASSSPPKCPSSPESTTSYSESVQRRNFSNDGSGVKQSKSAQKLTSDSKRMPSSAIRKNRAAQMMSSSPPKKPQQRRKDADNFAIPDLPPILIRQHPYNGRSPQKQTNKTRTPSREVSTPSLDDMPVLTTVSDDERMPSPQKADAVASSSAPFSSPKPPTAPIPALQSKRKQIQRKVVPTSSSSSVSKPAPPKQVPIRQQNPSALAKPIKIVSPMKAPPVTGGDGDVTGSILTTTDDDDEDDDDDDVQSIDSVEISVDRARMRTLGLPVPSQPRTKTSPFKGSSAAAASSFGNGATPGGRHHHSTAAAALKAPFTSLKRRLPPNKTVVDAILESQLTKNPDSNRTALIIGSSTAGNESGSEANGGHCGTASGNGGRGRGGDGSVSDTESIGFINPKRFRRNKDGPPPPPPSNSKNEVPKGKVPIMKQLDNETSSTTNLNPTVPPPLQHPPTPALKTPPSMESVPPTISTKTTAETNIPPPAPVVEPSTEQPEIVGVNNNEDNKYSTTNVFSNAPTLKRKTAPKKPIIVIEDNDEDEDDDGDGNDSDDSFYAHMNKNRNINKRLL